MKNNNVKYISTRGDQVELDFKEVIFEGLAPDGGLYMPNVWPVLKNETIESFSKKNYQEIAFDVISPYIDSSLTDNDLKSIIKSSYLCFNNKKLRQ